VNTPGALFAVVHHANAPHFGVFGKIAARAFCPWLFPIFDHSKKAPDHYFLFISPYFPMEYSEKINFNA
jgi:hypothetical protein